MQGNFVTCILVAVLLSACRANIIAHNPEAAVAEANVVLALLYLSGDYNGAYSRLSPEFRQRYSVNSLKELRAQMNARFGKLIELRGSSFLPMPGQRSMALFYTGAHTNRISYHRVLLVGDLRGYKISGLWLMNQPYPKSELGQNLRKEIIVK